MAETKKTKTATTKTAEKSKSSSKGTTEAKRSTVSGKNRLLSGERGKPDKAESRGKLSGSNEVKTLTKKSTAAVQKTGTKKKSPREGNACPSCRFYVKLKKTVEGKEILEPACCFHQELSNTKNMEKSCSLYIRWEGSLHGCK